MNFGLAKTQVQQFLKMSGKNVLFVRHGQSMGNYSGTITGWTDSKLTLKGREQAHKLYQVFHGDIPRFSSIHSSDLVRAIDTANIALGFPQQKDLIKIDPLLRELNFGKEEGIHFDSLPAEQQAGICKIDYQADGGECWMDTRKRAIRFFNKLPNGNHLIFGHGGMMCSLTWYIGCQDTLPNGSMIAISLDEATNEPKSIIFDAIFHKNVEEL